MDGGFARAQSSRLPPLPTPLPRLAISEAAGTNAAGGGRRLLRTRLPFLASFRVPGMRAAPAPLHAPLAHILDFPTPAAISGSGSRVHFDDTPRVMGSGTD